MENEGASLMETVRQEEKEQRKEGRHADYNRDSQALVRGPKPMVS